MLSADYIIRMNGGKCEVLEAINDLNCSWMHQHKHGINWLRVLDHPDADTWFSDTIGFLCGGD